MADITRRTKRYPSDLTDEEWKRIAPLMPPANRRWRKRATDFREIINALHYLVRSGCGWEILPVCFGLWQTTYWRFRRLMRRFLFQTTHDICLMLDRKAAGSKASLSGGVIDIQSSKALHARPVVMRQARRSLVVSAISRLIQMADRFQSMDKAAFLDFTVEIIRRSDTAKSFEILPRRRAVERTLGWMIRWRRLVKDYEQRIDVAEAMIHIAMGGLMLRQNAHP